MAGGQAQNWERKVKTRAFWVPSQLGLRHGRAHSPNSHQPQDPRKEQVVLTPLLDQVHVYWKEAPCPPKQCAASLTT